MTASPEHYRQRAQAAAAAGDIPGARAIMDAALEKFPAHAPLANSAGDLALRGSDPAAAEALFARALEVAPASLEYVVNRAIALGRLERHGEALKLLRQAEAAGAADARYCSARANAERARHRLGPAAQWYEACLALDPGHARALHGRAQVALERGEADATARFERVLTANPQDPDAWLGLAEALDAAGEPERARAIAGQLVAQAPHWSAALRLLAKLRLAAGEFHFASHFAEAALKRPDDPAIPREHIAVLDLHELPEDALALATEARRRFPADPAMALLEAVQAGVAGEDARAEAIFRRLALATPERWLQEARHSLRIGEYARAETLLEQVLEADPWHISAWALRDCAWRLTGNPRAEWLHRQPGLVQMVPLPDHETVLAEAAPLLHRLHDASAFPLGQSLRGGTQTRGNLFDRAEPELARLQSAIAQALETYRAELPSADPAHPLLHLRDAPWLIAGSWSVRLSGGGDHHAAHLHPQGILSSALYCELPEGLGDEANRAGWIELGRPASDLRLDLSELFALEPRRGHLALFPSTLYHATRPFAAGCRMTVAFDVAVADAG